MTLNITLPRLVGTREAAEDLVNRTDGTPEDGRVEVNGRALATSTISFADELVKKLIERGAKEILIVSAPERFRRQMTDAGKRHREVAVTIKRSGVLERL
ncbi:phospholipase/lecithinase/hemolysin [Curtobacterium luteum]|uniref:Phospholipase/lecithinase/hemolysin n=1 Tax=Curtobacterium luteum TaxID=33881 RepID=A0A8H9KZS6_9MICO|nr:hypothetical protein [Curtobacterium luteum]MBM7803358.1 phospholipase/lecithinase/hemolysin [Curtobacterium luteum]NUU51613.1 hypothetical protein [Curtobacterium luteum]GGL07810.1 hypothetical protein GCM10009769_27510 [Curtobacterium luteum]